MYVRMTKLRDIKGRIDYISNNERQEKILAFYKSFSKDDVSRLVKEQREQFSKKNRVKENQCIEGREFIFPLKHEFTNSISPEQIAEATVSHFKNKYKAECCCSIHLSNNGKNNHIHLILFDREKLEQPIIIPEKRATRTRYFDAEGKRTTKAKAVTAIKKGDIIEKEKTQYFGKKIQDFYSKDFLIDFKKEVIKNFGFEEFDKSRHFATKHIGKHNPKAKFIRQYNSIAMELNNYFDKIEKIIPDEERFGLSPKKMFLNNFKNEKVDKLTTEVLVDRFIRFQDIIEKSYSELFYKFDKNSNFINDLEEEE